METIQQHRNVSETFQERQGINWKTETFGAERNFVNKFLSVWWVIGKSHTTQQIRESNIRHMMHRSSTELMKNIAAVKIEVHRTYLSSIIHFAHNINI